jgi:hypothetical protein
LWYRRFRLLVGLAGAAVLAGAVVIGIIQLADRYPAPLDPAAAAEIHPLPTEPQGNRSRRASHRDNFLTASNNAHS